MSGYTSLGKYSEMYEATRGGRIFSKYSGRYLKGFFNKDGYELVTLYDNNRQGKQVRVHRFIAYCFVDGYEEGLQVNHIDGDKTNNHATNLEWVTAKENTRHAIEVLGTKGLRGELSPSYGKEVSEETRKKISETLKETNKGRVFYNNLPVKGTRVFDSKKVFFNSISQAGRELNIPATNISKVLKGKRKTAGGFRWEETP